MELTEAFTAAENEGLPGLPVRSPVRFAAWLDKHENHLLTIHKLFEVASYEADLNDEQLMERIRDGIHLYCQVMNDYREAFHV
jgi:hypothetical protein